MSEIISKYDLKSLGHLDLIELELDLSVSQIIWAPNGVGKSSIFNALKEEERPHLSFAEFSNNRASFAKEAKRKLRIGLRIHEIDRISAQKDELLAKCEIPNQLKHFGLTSVAAIEKVLPTYRDCKSNIEKDLYDYSGSSAKILIEKISEQDEQFFIDNWEKLKSLSEAEKDLEALKGNMVQQALAKLEQWIENDEYVCPLCESKQAIPIVEIIKERRHCLTDLKNNMVAKYSKNHSELDSTKIFDNFDSLRRIAEDESITNEKAVLSYCVSGADINKADFLEEASKRLIEINDEIKALTAVRDEFYRHLKSRERAVIDLFEVKFEIPKSQILFNDERKELIISLPRNVESYSTGEIDLMVTLVSLNGFYASDSRILILDDPITSFDVANQYIVLFDIIDIISDTRMKKSITIFTHNTDCINIADSQYKNRFKYFALDRWSDGLRMQPIDLNSCRNPSRRYLCQDALANFAKKSPCQQTKLHALYIEAAKNREEFSEFHKVFHYDGPSGDVPLDGTTLNNDYLVNLVDTLESQSINKIDFVARCFDKEILLIALRVWVEKQLYSRMSTNPGYVKLFGKQLSEKINYVFPKSDNNRWTGPSTVTRSYLMGKKVMLNQASHEQAQSIPFEYALNLSSYDIEKTIDDVKNHFQS